MTDDTFERERRKRRRHEKIGTTTPNCPRCAESDWRCFDKTTMPYCAKCKIKLADEQCDKHELDQRRLRRIKELGIQTPRCCTCSEDYWNCLELHHIAERKRDPRTLIMCINCHRKVTDDQKDHPASLPTCDPLLDKIGHILLNVAALLRILIDLFVECGYALIERASQGSGTIRGEVP